MNSKKTELIKEVFDLARNISTKKENSRLTMVQLRTVLFVEKKGIVKPTDIAKEFSITPASVTSQIDNLVKEGWLERKYNQDDKRVIEVVISERGKEELSVEIKSLHENSAWLFKALSKEEQGELLDLAKRANKAVSA